MGLNIKNERVHQLARRAAELTGKTQTGAIEEALVRLLREHGEDPDGAAAREREARVVRLVADYTATPAVANSAIRTPEDLYDDAGLPR